MISTVDAYILFLLGFGCLVLLTAWLPMVLSRAPLSLPIVCVAIGAGLFAIPGVLTFDPRPQAHLPLVERFSEMVVIISLMGAGLKLDRRIGWKRWILTWRLLGIAMPLTILGLALLGYGLLGLGVASALLLASVLAPTDPVLAADIQVGPPNSGEDGDTRFALTSEAGLNDALAFPFVHAAIALSLVSASSEPWLLHWFSVDVVWKLAAGLAVGVVTGYGLGYLVFRLPNTARLSRTGDGFVALGITCIAYGGAELVHGYGFLSVFLAALVMRMQERDHDYHTRLHDFAEELERLLMMALLVAFGGALSTGGLLQALGWDGIAFGMLALFVVRPLSAWIGLNGAVLPGDKRAVISIYGIRGIGSVYYLAYAAGHGSFDDADQIWSVVAFIVLVSIVLHGATASPVMAWLDRRRAEREAVAGTDPA
ncbi:cation transporter [Bosea sp. AAP35]|uniref:cation:proton antiporter n=1 Tax=Bosea sp. AAP35 TaxID=1523417 RepID=UPI0006B89A1A|nr:cation:proton antiporter [Bosea sp. AAP35]KPF69699.1 cation transporter [Bosea sp. AAP35]